MHARTRIRNAVIEALTGLTTTGSNVGESAAYPSAVTPCLVVRTMDEVENDEASDMDWQAFDLVLQVEARAEAEEYTLQTLLDTICAEAHYALMADTAVAGLVLNLRLLSTTIPTIAGPQAEKTAGAAIQTWTCTYRIDPTDPTNLDLPGD